MADYYPLLNRAVDALSDQSPAMRARVFERARAALLEQLRSVDPPMSEADIMRERLALDEAINRIERMRSGAGESPAARKPEPRTASGEAATFPKPPSPTQPRGAGNLFRAKPPSEAAPAKPESPPPPPLPTEHRLDDEAVPGTEPPVPFSLPNAGAPRPRRTAADSEGAARERPRIDVAAMQRRSSGRIRSTVLAIGLVLVVGCVAATAFWLRDEPPATPPPGAAAPGGIAALATPPDGDKVVERVTGEPAPEAPGQAPASGPAGPQATASAARPAQSPPAPRGDLAVAQRAVLYEENQADPRNPRATQARVVWRLDAVNAGQGQPLESVIKATVETTEPGLLLTMTMRVNRDQTLPASHIIELAFKTPETDPPKTVKDIGLLQFKDEEGVRGTPLAGLPVPVSDNLFLFGLSNLPADIERNVGLIQQRKWIDLPMRFSNGQRAILTFEKGYAGEQVIADAMAQWR